jgi:hypothetical protein
MPPDRRSRASYRTVFIVMAALMVPQALALTELPSPVTANAAVVPQPYVTDAAAGTTAHLSAQQADMQSTLDCASSCAALQAESTKDKQRLIEQLAESATANKDLAEDKQRLVEQLAESARVNAELVKQLAALISQCGARANSAAHAASETPTGLAGAVLPPPPTAAPNSPAHAQTRVPATMPPSADEQSLAPSHTTAHASQALTAAPPASPLRLSPTVARLPSAPKGSTISRRLLVQSPGAPSLMRCTNTRSRAPRTFMRAARAARARANTRAHTPRHTRTQTHACTRTHAHVHTDYYYYYYYYVAARLFFCFFFLVSLLVFFCFFFLVSLIMYVTVMISLRYR